MRMEIERDLYLNRLIARKHNGLIKVITGVRRCGKSFLLNSIFYRHLLSEGVDPDHIIRFAFDAADDLLLIGENLIQLQFSRVDTHRRTGRTSDASELLDKIAKELEFYHGAKLTEFTQTLEEKRAETVSDSPKPTRPRGARRL